MTTAAPFDIVPLTAEEQEIGVMAAIELADLHLPLQVDLETEVIARRWHDTGERESYLQLSATQHIEDKAIGGVVRIGTQLFATHPRPSAVIRDFARAAVHMMVDVILNGDLAEDVYEDLNGEADGAQG